MTDALVDKTDLSEKRLAPLQGGKTIKEILENAQTLFARMKSETEEPEPHSPPPFEAQGEKYVAATWLDALPGDNYENMETDSDRISAVNSDEAGLYRMFVNFSP